MDGAGTYLYADGRADVSAYEGGAEVGEGARWSPDRTQAWRLQKGQLDGRGETFDVESDQISLADALFGNGQGGRAGEKRTAGDSEH